MRMRATHSHPARPTLYERRKAYRLRVLIALAGSLAVTLLCARLPIYEAPRAVGWYVTHTAPLTLDLIDLPDEAGGNMHAAAPPQTVHVLSEASDEAPGTVAEEPAAAPAPPPPPPQPVPGRALLADADIDSHIVGGLGAYYIHIDYPMEAIRANVQGRLLLHFTIGTDGRASDIRVIKSLHPLCDSAAVAALNETRFIPARQDGEPVPMRVQLPVRFRLETPPTVAESAALHNE